VAVACNRATLVRLLRTTRFDRIVTVTETIKEGAAALERNVPGRGVAPAGDFLGRTA
jgi:hypothetical protein